MQRPDPRSTSGEGRIARPSGRTVGWLGLARGGLALVALSAISGAQSPAPVPDQTPHEERLRHWAWQELRTAEPDRRLLAESRGHPVDAFIAKGLEDQQLTAAPPAPAAIQLRRLWFDLVGLPPTPEAIARFGDNPSASEYAREVDLLLASPRFGERWARHWLDLMRYSETLGHEFDYELPNAWRYRDYVIRAFNDDVPYDQFVREHIAGDLLANPRRDAQGNNESVQATAAWWFVEQTHSPVDAMQHQADRIDNQIDVFGKAFLGMTVACARCHDHKFDAIPTRDYYSLFGILQGSRYVQASIKEVAPASPEYKRTHTLQRELARLWPAATSTEDDAGPTEPTAEPSPPQPRPAERTAGFDFRPEDVVIADARDPASRWYLDNDGFGDRPWTGGFCPDPDAEKPVLVTLPGPFWVSATAGGRREGTIATATFPLTHRYVHVRVAGDHSRIKLIVDGFHVVRDPIYGTLHRNIDKGEAHWQTIDVEMWLGSKAHLSAVDQRAPDLGDPRHDRGRYPDHAWLAVQAICNSPHAAPPETAAAPEVLSADPEQAADDWRQTRKQLAEAINSLPVAPTVPAMADGSGIDSPVYVRGNHHTPGEIAPRAFLSALRPSKATMPKETSGRLQLADAVLAADNPLPSRVVVNRIWHHLFGRGIVKSVDNFGALGEQPSHPDLLDYLARDLIANRWSVKHTIRRIVTSHTYRQSSQQRPEASAVDATNQLFHRQNVRPLEAEIVRDSLLAVSGRLNLTLYGKSIEQPREAITNARGSPKHHGPRDGDGRRSVYLAMRRNFMPEMLLAFDCPTPFATVGRRNTSNVPAQALALANSALVHDLCKLFAERVIQHSGNPAQRLQLAYQLAFARLPSTDELVQLLEFVTPPAEGFGKDEEVTTWTDAVHALVNTTEFRFRR